MDPLSIVAAITSLLTGAYQSSASLLKLQGSIKNPSAGLGAAKDDTYTLCGLLEQVKQLIAPQLVSGTGKIICIKGGYMVQVIQSCEVFFQRIDTAVQVTNEALNYNKAGFGQKVRLTLRERSEWPFRETQLQHIQDELSHAKTTLLLVVAVYDMAKLKLLSEFGNLAQDSTDEVQLRRTIISLHQMQRNLEKKVIDGIEGTNSHKNSGLLANLRVGGDSFSDSGSESNDSNDAPIRSHQILRGEDSRAELMMDIEDEGTILQAWMTIAIPVSDWSNPAANGISSGLICRIAPVTLPQSEIRGIVDMQLSQFGGSLFQALQSLTTEQRGWITDHAFKTGGELVSVAEWEQKQCSTVFGLVHLTSLLWVSRSTVDVSLATGLGPIGFHNGGMTHGWATRLTRPPQSVAPAPPVPLPLQSLRGRRDVQHRIAAQRTQIHHQRPNPIPESLRPKTIPAKTVDRSGSDMDSAEEKSSGEDVGNQESTGNRNPVDQQQKPDIEKINIREREEYKADLARELVDNLIEELIDIAEAKTEKENEVTTQGDSGDIPKE